jgi:hypothetical protein
MSAPGSASRLHFFPVKGCGDVQVGRTADREDM